VGDERKCWARKKPHDRGIKKKKKKKSLEWEPKSSPVTSVEQEIS